MLRRFLSHPATHSVPSCNVDKMKIGGRNNILYTNKKGPKSHGNVVVFQKIVISKSEPAPWSWVSHT